MIRDRIKKFVRIDASEIRVNPDNWRTHPEQQRTVLTEMLESVGLAGAVLVREILDGYELIDGHLRVELLADNKVPALVLDVDELEAKKLLATFDPISAMAEHDLETLRGLIKEIDLESAASSLLSEMTVESKKELPIEFDSCFEVVVECDNEQQQKELFDEMCSRGVKCRLMSM